MRRNTLLTLKGMVTLSLVLMVGAAIDLAAPQPSLASAATTQLSTNGEWPGVGKICESGSGGASTVRGVGSNTIHIAAFNDAGNTITPGLTREFVQLGDAFAAWCNASGGIDGRKIVVDDRDAALFNGAQQMEQACQSDFMAVGGGMALDQSSVSIRERCGLGQITGYVVSDASQTSSLQVDPNNITPSIVPAGWFHSLAKMYPKAVKNAGMGGQNEAAILEPEHKWEIAAEQSGWNVSTFQQPPLSVDDWTSYIAQLQTKGVQADWPADDSNIAPYLLAMATAGYKPAFIALSTQFYQKQTSAAVASAHGSLPPVFLETTWWPLELASQNPSTEQFVQMMHKYAKGDQIDFDDEEAVQSWILWAKSASACGAQLTVNCVLSHAASEKNWSAGGLQAPVSQVSYSNAKPVPSPCFVLLKVEPNKFVYDKAATQPTQSIWNCDPKNNVHLTAAQLRQVEAG
jgi:ABC-type branched-subunit amino acid transport system substrate-binding protein